MKTEWKRGDKAELARRCGISRQHLCDILQGRRRAINVDLAENLLVNADYMGYQTSIFDWAFPSKSDNPLFNQ
jgi:transcriptional regulator with XRE-family HTH domain